MTTKFYEYDNCSQINNTLGNFNKCNKEFGIGNNIINSIYYDKWNNLKDPTLESFVPFLVERKFQYYDPNSRDENPIGLVSKSNFLFFNVGKNNQQKHNILKVHLGNLQPDDVIKENIVNNFTDKLLSNSKSLYQNLLFKLTDTQSMRGKLNSYYSEDIVNLKKDIDKLNNDKLKEENTYSSKYYKLKNYETNIDILINSIFIVSLIFVIGILTNNGIIDYGYIINVILLIVLVIYLLLSLKTIRDRQYSNWDKRYFDYVNDISDKV